MSILDFYINDLAKEKALSFISRQIGELSKLHGGCPNEKQKQKIKDLQNFYNFLEKL